MVHFADYPANVVPITGAIPTTPIPAYYLLANALFQSMLWSGDDTLREVAEQAAERLEEIARSPRQAVADNAVMALYLAYARGEWRGR